MQIAKSQYGGGGGGGGAGWGGWTPGVPPWAQPAGGYEGEGKGKGQGQQDDGKQSNSAGQGQGDRNLGEDAGMKSNRVDVKVKGSEGDKGQSKSEIIKGASEEGFASRNYKEVYGDYSSVVEEVMEEEKVPKGYRYYVKRYFQLIKPREQE